jgi:hypothetical protein
MTYQEACQHLGREANLPSTLSGSKPAKLQWEPRVTAAPGELWQARARKLVDEAVYYLLRGSNTRAMVLGTVTPVSVLVESELDGLLLNQEAGDLVNVISLGNAQTRPDQGAAEILNQSKLILVFLDADQAGAEEEHILVDGVCL